MKLQNGRYTRFKNATKFEPKQYALRLKYVSRSGKRVVNELVPLPSKTGGGDAFGGNDGGYLEYWVEDVK